MSLSATTEYLASFDVAAYADRANRYGRMAMTGDAELVHRIQEAVDAFATPDDQSTEDDIGIASLFLEAQLYCLTHEKPRYEPYAAAALLRQLLGAAEATGTDAEQTRIWTVFRHILDDQLAFEETGMAGAVRTHKKDVSPTVCRQRYGTLTEVRGMIPEHVRNAPKIDPVTSGRLLDIVRDRTGISAISHLLVIPQTECHDEVAFLRIIQLCECLFWGTLISIREALTAYHSGDLGVAGEQVGDAARFAAPLVKLFHATRAMPPEHFLGFREATGEASAVQCRSWQELDAHMYGVLPEKRAVLADTPEVRGVLRLATPEFQPLVAVADRLGGTREEVELRTLIYTLDRHLLAWRKYHERQLAGKVDPSYLPAGAFGSGGTSGYPYLAAQKPPRVRIRPSPMDKTG